MPTRWPRRSASWMNHSKMPWSDAISPSRWNRGSWNSQFPVRPPTWGMVMESTRLSCARLCHSVVTGRAGKMG